MLLSVSMISGCNDQCSTDKVKSLYNPSRLKEVVFNKKNCGATTDFVYELWTARPDGSAGDLILRFDSGHRAEWAKSDEEIVELKWRGETQLDVMLNVPIRVFDEVGTADGIAVRYRYQPGTTAL